MPTDIRKAFAFHLPSAKHGLVEPQRALLLGLFLWSFCVVIIC
jgi:hypothetical protein